MESITEAIMPQETLTHVWKFIVKMKTNFLFSYV